VPHHLLVFLAGSLVVTIVPGPDMALVTRQVVPRGLAAAQATKRLWAEPGYGIVDFGAVLAAMPADYDGDYMIEVDEPSVPDRFESSRRCREWARRALPWLS